MNRFEKDDTRMKRLIFSVFVSFLFSIPAASQRLHDADEDRFKAVPSKEALRVLSAAPMQKRDIDSLLELVRSTSPLVRKYHREAALGRLASPDAKAPDSLGFAYMALLDDNDLDIKDAATSACARLQVKGAIPKIRKALKALPKHSFQPGEGVNIQEYRHAMAAAEALATMGDTEVIGEILDRESLSPSWEVLLPKFGGRTLSLVVEKARSNRESVRNGAIKAISSFNDPDALPQLKALLSDKDKDIRNAAVRGLIRAKSPDAMAAVKSAYLTLDDSGKSSVAMACLDQCDVATAMGYVSDFMKNGRQGWSKVLVVMALGKSKKPEAVGVLENLLSDPNDEVRVQAACQLARVTSKRYSYNETNLTRLAAKDCEYLKDTRK